MTQASTFIQNPNKPIHHKITLKSLFNEFEAEAMKGCGGYDTIFDDNMSDIIRANCNRLEKMSALNDLDILTSFAIKKGYILEEYEAKHKEEKQRREKSLKDDHLFTEDMPF